MSRRAHRDFEFFLKGLSVFCGEEDFLVAYFTAPGKG